MHAPAGYRIIEEIGRGGMGVVYRALQVDLKREVALKCLLPGLAHETEVMSRLRREAGAMSKVAHPGLVKLLDVGEDAGQPYLSMEIVPGASLAQLLKTDFQKVAPRADAILDGILEALAVVHAAGLTHRDIKPSNVMLRPDGRPVLMDLGLVKELAGDGTLLTQAGQLVGTPCYLAPEVMRGAPVSPLADMWALGCVYFELATGRRLWASESLPVLCATIIEADLPDLAATCPTLSPARRALMARLLAKDPADRPKDAREALAIAKQAATTPRSGVRMPRSSGAVRAPGGRSGGFGVDTPLRNELVTGPARPRSWRSGMLLAGALSLAAFAVRARHPSTWAEVTPASASPVASTAPARASPAPTLATPRPVAAEGVTLFAAREHADRQELSRGWDDRYDYYHRMLEMGGKPAERAMRDIQRLVDAPLASVTPEVGIRWLDLGRWLKRGAKLEELPPTLRDAGLRQLAQQILWSTGSLFSPRQLATVLICEAPGEARGWLALGYVLCAEGDFAAGQRAFTLAMQRPLGEVSETEWPRYLLTSLILAGSREPDRLLERKWPEWAVRGDIERIAWEVLVETLETSDLPRLEGLLAQGERMHPTQSLFLVWSRLAQLSGPAGGARAALLRGIKRLPKERSLQHALIEEAGLRGALDEARGDVTPDVWLTRADLLAGLIRGERRELALHAKDGSPNHALRALLDAEYAERGAGALPGISKHLEAEKLAGDERASIWAFDLLGQGDEHQAFKDQANRALDKGIPGWLIWELEGSLATDAGEPWMKRVLAQMGAASGVCQPARRALWLARRGHFAAALDLLDDVPPMDQRLWPTEYLLEPLVRPFYAAALGAAVSGANAGLAPVDRVLLDRARAAAGRLLTGDLAARLKRAGVAFDLQRRYLSAVLAGRLADAGALARELAPRQPFYALWGESTAWAAWIAHDDAAFAHELERGRKACVFAGWSTWWLRRLQVLSREGKRVR